MRKPGPALAEDSDTSDASDDGLARKRVPQRLPAVARLGPEMAGMGLLVMLLAFASCADQQDIANGTAQQKLAAGQKLTSEEEIEVLINMLGNTALPPEMRAHAVTLLAAYDPAETVQPLVAMLAANEPLVLVAVIENLPQAAEDLALPELKQLGSSHPNPEVQAAALARLTEFEEFHQ